LKNVNLEGLEAKVVENVFFCTEDNLNNCGTVLKFFAQCSSDNMIKRIRTFRRDIRKTKFLPTFGELGEERRRSISGKT
jgi:hypothetical protein